jgi:Tfp pilus assembly protein PilF
METQHQQLGEILLEDNARRRHPRVPGGAGGEAHRPAQAHYNLARAYNQNHQPEQAKDELIDAMEAPPDSGRRKSYCWN